MVGSTWSYHFEPTHQDPGFGQTWLGTGFDDSLWPTGVGLFGSDSTDYGYPFNTPVTPPGSGGPVASYYRARFNWSGSGTGVIFTGTLRIDDGCVIYLNGQECYAFNMPATRPVNWDTLATTSNPGGEPVIETIEFPGTNVVVGENILAVEVHNNSTGSSDVVFGLDLFGDIAVGASIITQPVGTNVFQGQSFTLEVVADGLPAPTYQWYLNSLPITGATDPTYTVNFAEIGVHNGNYYVVVSNPAGTVTSTTVAVGVNLDQQGPEFVSGAVLQNGTVRVTCSEVMSNSWDTFSTFVFAGDEFVGVSTVVLQANGTDFILTPSDPLTVGVNYQIFIGDGAVQDIWGNGGFGDEADGGIYRDLATELIIVPIDATWSYDDTVPALELLTNDPPHFYDIAYDDGGWKTGPALLGTETDALPDGLVINTPVLNTGGGGPITSYYRHKFFLPGALADIQSVRVRTLIDDGAVLYVNGTEVVRLGVPDGQDSTTYANRTIGEAGWEGFYDIPLNLLVDDENLLAADLHNVNATSSDNVWGCEVVAVVGNVVITAPTIETPPVSPGTLNEGDSLSLTVVARGTQPLNYQWTLNGTDIPDGTNSTYSVASVTTTNAGDYVVRITNIGGSISSTPVTVDVNADLTSPVLVSAVMSLSPTEVALVFSEPISRETATNTENYTVELRVGGGALTVLNADYVGSSRSNIVLTVDPRTDENYKITIRDLTDRSAAANILNPNPTVQDLATEVILVDYDAIGEWTYNDSGRNFDADYFLSSFVPVADEGWSNGLPLFYGKRGTPGILELPQQTTLDLTNAPGVTNRINQAQTICFYFRGNIDLAGVVLADYQPLKLQYILDDGMRVYINESEVYRVGMPTGVITNETLANRTQGNDQYWETPEVFDSSTLVAGDNLVALDVHQTSATSSDIAFALRLVGTQQTVTPALRITSVTLEEGSNNVIINHNGTDVFVQETTALAADPAATVWTTRSGGPHASPYNAGTATGQRFFRLSDTP